MKTISLSGKGASPGYILFVLMTLCSLTLAQQLPENQSLITGTVYDAGGGILDASVSVKGTDVFTYTDENGHYLIEADPTDTLVFGFPGYETKEVTVGSQSVIEVELLPSSVALDEAVINAGYYQVKDRERTGSISRVTADEIENQPVGNVLSAIQGRMAGVSIVQNTGVPGSGYDIQIRGMNSLRREGNYPLYIIDGVPVMAETPSFNSAGIMPFHGISPLNAINPNDIESIEVLKDADATAIYGSRGANGVILVTTKKGKSSKILFNVNTSYAINSVTGKMKMLNTSQYLKMRQQAFENDGIDQYPADAFDINGTWKQDRYTDWQKLLIGNTSAQSNVQFALNGGNEQTQFRISGSHSEQSTVFAADFKYKTNNISSSLTHQSEDGKLNLKLSGLFSDQSNDLINSDQTNLSLQLPPNAPELYDEAGNLNWEENTFTNPMADFESTYFNNSKTFQQNLNLSYKLFPSLSVVFNSGINYLSFREYSLSPSTMYNPAYGMTAANSAAMKGTQQRFSYLLEPQLNYKNTLGLHEIDILAGVTYQQTEKATLGTFGYGFQSDALITNLGAASMVMIMRDNNVQYNYAAIYGRINYQYDRKYILNLTGRRDGSSRFGPGKRFANFGAIGVAWLFSEESFLEEQNWLNYGKLRASIGTTGSDLIGDYQYLDTYSLSDNSYGGNSGLNPTGLFNPNFSWEKTTKTEIAFETGFWQDYLNFTASWFINRSSNQLIGIPLPGTTGFSSIQSNLPATVENTGWEFEISIAPIRNNIFRWKSSFNLSIPKNKLVEFPNIEGSTYANRYIIGQPLSIVKVYNFEGINQQTGIYQFTDFNSDGNISSPDDNLVAKNIGVKYFGGWFNEINFKSWNLSFLFQFVKQKQWNYNHAMLLPGSMNNQPVEILNVWSEENPNGFYMPYSTGNDPAKLEALGFFANSTAAISDASFIRLKNIQISYHLPLKKIAQEITFYIQGQNLWTISNYFGLDPEFSLSGFLPPLKTYSFGVQFNF